MYDPLIAFVYTEFDQLSSVKGMRFSPRRPVYARAIRFMVTRTGVTKFEGAVFGPREVQNAEIQSG
jgi:hypothetical protein